MTNNGIKYDKDKPRLADFLGDFKEVFLELAKVYEFGTNKYGRENWKQVENGKERFSNAMIRHYLKDGNDEETGINHQTHTAYNALMRLYFILQKRIGDDIDVYMPRKEISLNFIEREENGN